MGVGASNARGDAFESLWRWRPDIQRRLVVKIKLTQGNVGNICNG
jgi:hypothetical protein